MSKLSPEKAAEAEQFMALIKWQYATNLAVEVMPQIST